MECESQSTGNVIEQTESAFERRSVRMVEMFRNLEESITMRFQNVTPMTGMRSQRKADEHCDVSTSDNSTPTD
jgi:hypothetical protein